MCGSLVCAHVCVFMCVMCAAPCLHSDSVRLGSGDSQPSCPEGVVWAGQSCPSCPYPPALPPPVLQTWTSAA